MNRLPVPFAERRQRLPQAGRIRSGEQLYNEKRKKWQPSTLGTFRFTAPTSDDLQTLATIYGGEVKPWSNPKSEDRFELYSEASQIDVILPPDPLGDGPTYELWGGKGLARSCDGITCEQTAHGPEGPEQRQDPCLCRQRQKRECSAKLRLSVILPQLPLRGIWRFDTSSDLAADEMPGMVGLILGLQERGLASAELRLERRQSMGGSHRFVVPALGVPATFEQLVEIGSGPEVHRLTSGPGLALTQGTDDDIYEPSEDDILDADVVELTAKEKASALREARAQAEAEGLPLPTRYEDL